jgi:hypothetical protein
MRCFGLSWPGWARSKTQFCAPKCMNTQFLMPKPPPAGRLMILEGAVQTLLVPSCNSVRSLASRAFSCPRWYSVALFFWVRLISSSISAILQASHPVIQVLSAPEVTKLAVLRVCWHMKRGGLAKRKWPAKTQIITADYQYKRQ